VRVLHDLTIGREERALMDASGGNDDLVSRILVE
jgi:hypothetical protein